MENNNNNNNNSETFGDKVKNVFSFIAQKTDDVVTTSKAQLKINSINNKIRDAYLRLGNSVYDSKKQNQDIDELIDLIVAEIDALVEERKTVEDSMEKEEAEEVVTINPNNDFADFDKTPVVPPMNPTVTTDEVPVGMGVDVVDEKETDKVDIANTTDEEIKENTPLEAVKEDEKSSNDFEPLN